MSYVAELGTSDIFICETSGQISLWIGINNHALTTKVAKMNTLSDVVVYASGSLEKSLILVLGFIVDWYKRHLIITRRLSVGDIYAWYDFQTEGDGNSASGAIQALLGLLFEELI